MPPLWGEGAGTVRLEQLEHQRAQDLADTVRWVRETLMVVLYLLQLYKY